MPHEQPTLAFIDRAQALIDALRAGELRRPDLLARVGAAYPGTASARPMIDRCHLGKRDVAINHSSSV